MKSILEQNFVELYAQVEERVKCIKPIKQIDTYTKILMWTSLNEILMDVFGDSRFMWMIETTDFTFVVKFVDKYKSEQTNNLVVQYATTFVWPSEDDLLTMSCDELSSFVKHCKEETGFTQQEINTHYGRNYYWIQSLLGNRRRGHVKRGSDADHEKRSIGAIKQFERVWNYEETLLRQFARFMYKHNIPRSYETFAETTNIPLVESRSILICHCRRDSSNCPEPDAEMKARIRIMISVYIDKLIEKLSVNVSMLRSQTTIPTNGLVGKDRTDFLIKYLKDKKCELDSETKQYTTKEVKND